MHLPLQILFEDNHLIALNKSVSEIVEKDRTGDESLDEKIKSLIKTRDKKPGNVFLGICHRIDRPVSGVVIFAKTGKALSRMNEIFRNQEIEKKYWAIVKNKPPDESGELINHIARNPKQNKAYVRMGESAGTRLASLSYKITGRSDNYYLLEIELHSGRHHQIRAQLANIGCPVKGDLKYGFPRSNKNGGISLHARSVKFVHPVSKKDIYIEAPPPQDDLFRFFNNVNNT